MTSWVRDKAVHESRGLNESRGSNRQPDSSLSPKPASIRSSKSPPRPVPLDRKSASTPVERLSSVEQKRLELTFKSHSNRMELMTKKALQEYFHLEDLEGSQIIDRLFFAFGNTNSIDFPSFLVAIATLAKGTPGERAQFIFKMLDLKGTSLIDRNGLKKMLLSFLNAALEIELEDENLAEVQEEVKGVSAQDVEQVVEELVDEAVTAYGSHGNFLTAEEFKAYLLSNPIIVNALSV